MLAVAHSHDGMHGQAMHLLILTRPHPPASQQFACPLDCAAWCVNIPLLSVRLTGKSKLKRTVLLCSVNTVVTFRTVRCLRKDPSYYSSVLFYLSR
jgi:hypothetical protein